MAHLLARLLICALYVVSLTAAAGPKVLFKTSQGDFTVELDDQRAPRTVDNFLGYVKSGFYSNTLFHRVIDGFMIQGGGFDRSMQQKETRAPIKLESQNGLKNVSGSIAMARTGNPDSATAQFFINVVDNPSLDFPNPDGYGYAVFGKVVTGMETVSRIRAVPTTSYGPMRNIPSTPVVIESATLLEK